MSFYTEPELRDIGLKDFGERVRLSRKASLHGVNKIMIGDNTRIDDFCVLSAGDGGIAIGSHIHVAVYTLLIGRGKILLEDFANVSSRVSIYSSSDDFSGEWMTNPTIPEEFTNVVSADVRVGRHVIIGSGSVILPGVVLEEGVAVGALSLVKTTCAAFGVYAGSPARKIGERKRNLLGLEQRYRQALQPGQ